MTDKQYIHKISAFLREIHRLDPLDPDDVIRLQLLFDSIRCLNSSWHNSWRFRHWHYIVSLISLLLFLAFVVFSIMC